MGGREERLFISRVAFLESSHGAQCRTGLARAAMTGLPAQGGSAGPEPAPTTQSSLLLARTEASLVPKATLVPSGLSAPRQVMEIQRWAWPLPARRGQVRGFEAGRGGGRTREPRVTAAPASTSLRAPGMPSCPPKGRLRTSRGTTLRGW